MTKAYRLHIENFLSIESMDLDLSPGVQGFVGKNASGKTNILTALQSILSGEHDTKLIKDGEKRSEVRLEEIDDGEVVASVSRIQTESSNRLAGKGLPTAITPKKWLSWLLDDVAINPIRLISEDPVKYLKQHLNIPGKQEEIVKINCIPDDAGFDLTKNSFNECERLAAEIHVTRKAQYLLVRHNHELVEELRKNLPEMTDAPMTRAKIDDLKSKVMARELTADAYNKNRSGRSLEITELRAARDTLLSVIETDKKRIENSHYEAAIEEGRRCGELSVINNKYTSLKAEREKSNALLAQKIETDTLAVKTHNEKGAVLLEHMKSNPEITTSDIQAEKDRLIILSIAAENYEELSKRHAQLKTKEADHKKAKDEHDYLDASYKYYAYDLPKTLIDRADLPVKGLEFRDQQLFVEGRHIDRLSTAERHLVAVNLAVALAKAKGHIAVTLDGIEVLDAEHQKKFLESVKNTGIKILYTRHGTKEHQHETELK